MVRCSFFDTILFVFFLAGVIGQYENCTGQVDTINDGKCDMDNHNVKCGYDGGDCCECSCATDRLYPCGFGGFNCSDPDMLGNTDGCQIKSSSIAPCSSDDPETCLVNDTMSATSLAAAVNCSGGTFNVIWRGSVLVDYTIGIPNGTTLNVTGEGSGAEINGGGKTRLFKVVDGTLRIEGLILSNGIATYGGAIAALRSSVFLNQTSCRGNMASSYGGAIYIGMRSNILWEGKTVLKSNHACQGGGAVTVAMSSIASWDGTTEMFFNSVNNTLGGAVLVRDQSRVSWNGVTSFVNNTAEYGGVFGVYDSDVSWDGATSFVGNTASYDGGALTVYYSSVSWDGNTSFVDNRASYDGGALYVYNSNVSWDGATSFVDNTASNDGGALTVYYSSVSWDGNTSFVDNRVSYDGGALYVYNSNVSWDGVTSFVDNTASNDGGALTVYYSSVSWDGNTSFVDNRVSYDGGALYVYNSNVSWDGVTSFVNNTVGSSGGALYFYSNSMALWNGETSFVNNAASYNGGAVCVYYDSIVSWDGAASFVNNTVGSSGGAMYFYSNSMALWNGETSFVNNAASYNGGAVCVYYDSIVSWDGAASFVNNTVGSSGGALYFYSNSMALWNGETSFVNNAASYNGGAVCVYYDSIVSWDGAASYVNNTVGSSGGALRISDKSSVSWNGKTSFVKNTAGATGGAMYVYTDSSASWTGETSFTANIAMLSFGGAFLVSSNSNINVGGDTNFIDNKAASDGGAAYVSSSYFIVNNNTTVLFQDNTCGDNGGAIAFNGDVVTYFPPSVTFLGNTARAAGGAIHMLSVSFGILLEGTRFISNSAAIGGGLYSRSSGNIVTEVEDGNFDNIPTTLIGCEFIGNEATRMGGAMDSSEGWDMIVNTSFVKNTAIIGGALSLVGVTHLIGLEFIANSAYEKEGPAISNDGDILDFSRCTFADNVFNCQPGYYLEFNNITQTLWSTSTDLQSNLLIACTQSDVLFDGVCKGCDTQCSGCRVEGKQPTRCVEALEHSSAEGVGATLETLLIERGYWRATSTSMDILACYNSEACLGGLTGNEGYCREGYEGPYCSICSIWYSQGLGFVCNKCPDNTARGIALAVVMAGVLLLVFVAFLSFMLSGKMENVDHGIVARVTRFIPLQSLKIVIVVWQILTQFSTVANVIFPSVYQRFLDGVDILNFDLSWVFSAECIIDTDFHDQLLLATLGPLVCMAILGCTFVAAMRRSRDFEEARGIVRRKHLSMVLLFTFLIYSSVSSMLFKTFACDDLDDGKNYLRADYRIECDSSKHKALEIYAGFMVVLYVIGIPAFYGVLLYNNREALMKNTDREEDESIKPITDLWKPYRPDRFYYEVIECVRRVLLTGALVFIYPNTASQIAVALMMATFFMIVSEALAPNASAWDMWCSRTGHAIVFTSIFLALLLKVDVSGERASSQKVFESVLIAAHSCLILFVVVEAAAMVMVLKTGVKEDAEPRIRPSLSFLSPGTGRGGVILDSPPPYESVVENMS